MRLEREDLPVNRPPQSLADSTAVVVVIVKRCQLSIEPNWWEMRGTRGGDGPGSSTGTGSPTIFETRRKSLIGVDRMMPLSPYLT